MRRLVGIFIGVVALIFVGNSCDKIDNAYKQIATIDVDESLYPGDWDDYMNNYYPIFEENTNTDVNVLVEDYTGHTCVNCPQAAELAHDLHTQHPNRVFIASIHIDPGAAMSFQAPHTGTGQYTTDHTNADGIAYGEEFANGFNFFGNPQGTINRQTVEGEMFAFTGTWESRTENLLNENNLRVNIQSQFNYFDETDGGFLHVEFEKKTDDPYDLNAVVYVIEDTLTDWQTMNPSIYGIADNPNYLHRDKHLGSIDGNPWGVPVFTTDDVTGDKTRLDYSYKIPDDMVKENLHLLIYVYDVETYEIYQVIRQDIE